MRPRFNCCQDKSAMPSLSALLLDLAADARMRK